MFEEDSCFICGKPTEVGSLYCSHECKSQDSARPVHGSRSSRSASANGIHPIADVPALSPYTPPHDPDSDVPEAYLGESALHTTPSTSPTSSLYTDDDDDEDLIARQRDTRLLAKSLPHDMQNFDRQTTAGFQSYHVILRNYQRPPPRPKHPNLSVPVASQPSVNLHFRRIPARTNGIQSPPFRPHTREPQHRSVSDRLIRSSQSSPSRRHSFPTLANLGLNLPSPQPSPLLRPTTKPSRPKHSLVARHSTSSYQQRPKLDMTAKRPATVPQSSPETPKMVQQPRQTEAQAIAAMARARGSSASRPRFRDDEELTTPTQTRESDRGRSRTRQPPSASRSRSRSKSRSRSNLSRMTPAFDMAEDQREGRRPSRGLLPSAFGIGALTRGKSTSEEREEFRGRRGRAF
ncbi:hypothetical protein CALCODRAFT_509106 [Calocera cornea HHB12733]|uniref:Uncharacterized protein n=1 Tax=Calocera cornea HHB12733 TaxID=1353952 RepID=A0A165FPC1_9BASI|nr:hypothetical protein CALCODRAFT_509106 [Calocera cornea HHB12733]